MSVFADFWAALPLGPGVALLDRDENGLAALNKPAGILSHPNSPRDLGRSLLRADYILKEEVFRWPGGRLWLLNRLDSATSGVILVAAEEELAAAIKEQFRRKEIRKVYVALVFGRPPPAPEVWRDRLEVRNEGGKIRTASRGSGGPPLSQRRQSGGPPLPLSETRMSVLGTGPELALLRLEPHTGRSHQLRVQCARRRLPIVGDQTYGDFRRNRQFAARTGRRRLFLHSLETSFDYQLKGRGFHFSAAAPLPPEFVV